MQDEVNKGAWVERAGVSRSAARPIGLGKNRIRRSRERSAKTRSKQSRTSTIQVQHLIIFALQRASWGPGQQRRETWHASLERCAPYAHTHSHTRRHSVAQSRARTAIGRERLTGLAAARSLPLSHPPARRRAASNLTLGPQRIVRLRHLIDTPTPALVCAFSPCQLYLSLSLSMSARARVFF